VEGEVIGKPATHAEMVQYMRWIGVEEGFDFWAHIIENGWAADDAEAQAYLESLDIYPNDD
jgi:hypothetical protein